MSNIESTKSAYKTFATGDLAALKEYFTPRSRGTPPTKSPPVATIRASMP